MTHRRNSLSQTTFNKIRQQLIRMLKVSILSHITHFVFVAHAGVIKGWLVVHDELEEAFDHVAVDEMRGDLKVGLSKVFKQQEKLIEVTPVNSGTVHHVFDKHFN